MSITAVSKMAGVSIATVSRVMNNHPSVTAETAQAVRRAVKELNYSLPARKRRKSGRSTLRALRHRSVALLFPDPMASAMKTVLSGRLTHGINEELAKHESSLVIAGLVDWDRMPGCIESRSVDGVIVRGTVPIEQLFPLIRPIGCVTVFETVQSPSYGDQILEDSSLIAELAVAYLIGKGCKRLACISHDPMHPAYSARFDAFVRSVRYAGRESVAIAAAAPYRELVAHLLGAPVRPDGLFVAGNDTDMSRICGELAKCNIKVGRDLQVISTAYDPAFLDLLGIGMDYIDIEPENIGKAAVQALISRLNSADKPRRRLLVAPTLVNRR